MRISSAHPLKLNSIRTFAWTALLLLGLLSPAATPADDAAPIRQQLQMLLESARSIRVGDRFLSIETLEALAPFYRNRDFAPVWIAGETDPQRIDLLLAAIAGAAEHGLDPADYAPGPAQGFYYELALTDAYRRYALDIRTGRLRPQEVGQTWAIATPAFAPLQALEAALSSGKLRQLLIDLPPSHPGYRRLKDALKRYRDIAAQGGWRAIPAGPSLKQGQQDPRIPLLRLRLLIEGDLALSTAQGERYDAELEAAVRRFQSRHGLTVDGIVGPATTAALNVSVDERIRQILSNLTRWRWLPPDLGDRYLAVNIAAATLEVIENRRTAFSSKVIVGARRHPTPVLEGVVESIVFNPPWNAPLSIAINEILPRLRRDPGYLARENMVIVGRRIDPFGLRIDWTKVSARGFDLRFRQRPGANNALGRIKFDLQSPFSVYLHDTPDKSLFDKPARFFSHGCIRVERPRELAAYLLADQSWSLDTIDAAIATAATRRVSLTQPLHVYLLYWTAFVNENGTVQFRDDVYRLDSRLQQRLDKTIATASPSEAEACSG